MKNIRVISRLDIKGPNLVKGIHLEGLRVLGKPDQYAEYYYKNGADELVYFDIVASLYGRNSLHGFIERTAKNIFIPLIVGGGLRSIDDITSVLRAGADKVSLNTFAINNPDFIKKASEKFGSSTIVVAIDAKKHTDGKYYAFTDNGREETGKEVLAWAKQAEELGAGEIILTSIDNDGTGLGFDMEITKSVSDAVSIPVIAGGGAGKCSDIIDVISYSNIDAVSIASLFHYNYIDKNKFTDNAIEGEGNIEYLKSGRISSKHDIADIKSIKQILKDNNYRCRLS